MNVIETQRLILRKLRVEDAEDLFCIYSNPETMKFMGKGSSSVDEARSYSETHWELL